MAKAHGMMMLLDWSGSMSDVLFNTVKQLINLVEFCRKVNIPYEVYFFTSERSYHKKKANQLILVEILVSGYLMILV